MTGFVAATNGATGSSLASSFAVNVPAGLANGNFMAMGVCTAQGTTVTTPTGWTTLQAFLNASTGVVLYTFWRYCAAEPGSYTVSLGATTTAAGTILGFEGVYQSANPIRVQGTATGAAVTTVTSPTLAGVLATDEVITLAGARPESAGTPTLSCPNTSGWTDPATAAGVGGVGSTFPARTNGAYSVNGSPGAVTTTLSSGIAVVTFALKMYRPEAVVLNRFAAQRAANY